MNNKPYNISKYNMIFLYLIDNHQTLTVTNSIKTRYIKQKRDYDTGSSQH